MINATGIKSKNRLSPMERSRRYFILEGITGIGQFSLTNGAFLAGFISFLEGSEKLNGSLGVIPAAMGIMQIFSTLLLRKGTSRKERVIQFAIVLRVLLSSVYFVPFMLQGLGLSRQGMLLGFVLCFVFAYGANSLIAPLISSWMVDVSPLALRGKYLAAREKISLIITASCTIVLGKVLDYNKSLGEEFTGFLIVGIVLVIMGFLNIYSLLHIEDVKLDETKNSNVFLSRIMEPLKDAAFKRIILLYILWNFALFIGGPYIAVYMVEKLSLTYTYMLTLSVISILVRVAFTSLWGSLADKKSWFLTSSLSLTILALTHFSWGFVTLENYKILVPCLHILGGIAWAGAGISIFNLQFLFARKQIRTMSIGLNAAIGGIISIIAVNVGGFIIEKVDGISFVLFNGFVISGMQFSFMLSGLFILMCPVFIIIVLRRYKNSISME